MPMVTIPPEILSSYTIHIKNNGVEVTKHSYYLKWLRYYLDFCHKYNTEKTSPESITPFLEKLRDKKQAQHFLDQANHAISLFLEMSSFNTKEINNAQVFSRQSSQLKNFSIREKTTFPTESALRGKQKGADWTAVFAELRNAIKIRHLFS